MSDLEKVCKFLFIFPCICVQAVPMQNIKIIMNGENYTRDTVNLITQY